MNLLGSLYNSIFPDPSKKANQIEGQIPGAISPYYKQYMDHSMDMLPGLEKNYQDMLADPNALMQKIGAGYHQSPGYQFQLNQGMTGINNANAAGGLLGSNAHQQQAGSLANNLANQNYNQYMQNALGQYNTALQGATGMSNNLYNTGFNASNSLAQNIAQELNNQSQFSYAGQASQNKGLGDMLGGIMGWGTSSNTQGTGTNFGDIASMASLFL